MEANHKLLVLGEPGFFLVSLSFLVLMHGEIFWSLFAGHAFYFLDRLYPKMTGRRPLRTPSFIKAWFAEDAAVVKPAADPRFAPAPQEDVIIDE